MYSPFGIPATYFCAAVPDTSEEAVVGVCHDSTKRFLAICTPTELRIWSGGRNRLPLGVIARPGASNAEAQSSLTDDEVSSTYVPHRIHVIWHPTSRIIGVLECHSTAPIESRDLEIYDLKETELEISTNLPKWMESVPETSTSSSTLHQVEISFRKKLFQGSPTFASLGGCASICLFSDKQLVIGGCNGSIIICDWEGVIFQRLYFHTVMAPDASPAVSEADSHFLETINMEGENRSTRSYSATSSRGSFANLTKACIDVAADRDMQILASVFSDGSCLVTNVKKLTEKGVPRAVTLYKGRGHSKSVTRVSFSDERSILAAGRLDGVVSLYRLRGVEPVALAPNGSDRTVEPFTVSLHHLIDLSMSLWGFPSKELGPISCLEWSADGRVFAAGFERRGLVVWTAGGCRLLSTLPQVYDADSSRQGELFGFGVLAMSWGAESFDLTVIGYPVAHEGIIAESVRRFKRPTTVSIDSVDESALPPEFLGAGNASELTAGPRGLQESQRSLNDVVENGTNSELASPTLPLANASPTAPNHQAGNEQAQQTSLDVLAMALNPLDILRKPPSLEPSRYFSPYIYECALVKGEGGLGLHLQSTPDDKVCWVHPETPFPLLADGSHGPAEASGVIHQGDILWSLNGQRVLGQRLQEVVSMLRDLPEGPLTMQFVLGDYESLFEIAAHVVRESKICSWPAVTEEEQLTLYALYKYITSGPLVMQQPSEATELGLKKHQKWKELGSSLLSDVAKAKYIRLVLSLLDLAPQNSGSPIALPKDSRANGQLSGPDTENTREPEGGVAEYQAGGNQKSSTAKEETNESVEDKNADFGTVKNSSSTPIVRDEVRAVPGALPEMSAAFSEIEGRGRGESDVSGLGTVAENEVRDDSPRARLSSTNLRPHFTDGESLLPLEMTVFPFLKGYRTVPAGHNEFSKQTLLGPDYVRILDIAEWDQSLISWWSLPIPQSYNAANWPLRKVSVSEDGLRLAVTGKHGVAIYNRSAQRWRLFGNESQEREVLVTGLCWWKSDILFLSALSTHEPVGKRAQELLVFPRNHLDFSSLLSRQSLPQIEEDRNVILQVDTARNLLIIASVRTIIIYSVLVIDSVDQVSDPRVELTLLKDMQCALPREVNTILELYVIGRLQSKPKPQELAPQTASSWSSWGLGWLGGGSSAEQSSRPLLPLVAILDGTDCLWIYDLETGRIKLIADSILQVVPLLTNSEWPKSIRAVYGLYRPDGVRFWFPLLDHIPWAILPEPFKVGPGGLTEKELLPLLYTLYVQHRPRELDTLALLEQYPLSDLFRKVLEEYADVELIEKPDIATTSAMEFPLATLSEHEYKESTLEFNVEVSPLGVHPKLGVMVGIAQDLYDPLARQRTETLPAFELLTDVQPLVHGVLRILLSGGRMDWAMKVAIASSSMPYFANSLEYLLHSVLEDAAIAKRKLDKTIHQQNTDTAEEEKGWNRLSNLLAKTLELLRNFASYRQVVAAVARKTEMDRWPILFPCAGDPKSLFDLCIDAGQLYTASMYLILIFDAEEVALQRRSFQKLLGSTSSSGSGSASYRHGLPCAQRLIVAILEKEDYQLASSVRSFCQRFSLPPPPPPDGVPNGNEEMLSSGLIEMTISEYALRALQNFRLRSLVECLRACKTELPRSRSFVVDKHVAFQAIENQFGFKSDGTVLTHAREAYRSSREALQVLYDAVSKAKYVTWITLLHSLLLKVDEWMEARGLGDL